MITIFGTTYFTIGAGLIVLALAAPLLLWFSFWLLRPNIEGKPRSTRWLAVGGTTLVLLLLTAAGLFWDVYLIGQRAKELCRASGLSVNKVVATNSFVGSTDIGLWSQHGFRFVESEFFGRKQRHELIQGEPRKLQVSELVSEYQVESVDQPVIPNNSVIAGVLRKRGHRIIERETGSAIAELSEYTIRHGWLDHSLARFTGFVVNSHTCGKTRDGKLSFAEGRLDRDDLILAALKPK